jgi:magnesium-transporting ATPase (P-type)
MGDSAEKLFFESGIWKFDGANRAGYQSKNSNMRVAISQAFPFRSDLKRMSTIVTVTGFGSG